MWKLEFNLFWRKNENYFFVDIYLSGQWSASHFAELFSCKMNSWGLTALINTIIYCYLASTKPTQPFLPVVHFLFSTVLLHFSPSALTVHKDVSLLVLEISIQRAGNCCLGVGVHCMTMRLSNLGKTSVFKKPQTFMDEKDKDEDRELDRVLQALPEILSLHWDVLFIVCAKLICANVCFIQKYMVPKKEAINGHSGRAWAWQSYIILPLQILSLSSFLTWGNSWICFSIDKLSVHTFLISQ